MPAQMNQMMRRLGRAFGGFTTGQKVIAALALVGVVIGGTALARWVTEPTYTPLFSNLAGSDASAVVDQLTTDGVKYQLTNGGQTVLVPKDVVYTERVKLSGKGLPASDASGYSLLDQQGVTASQFQQQVTYQRALEGELAKTIQAIGGVQAAVVHLAIPQKDVFLDEQQKPTASVLVSTNAGATLSANQVQSIVHLVASSVEGMDPQQVTVVDGKGQLLSSATSDGTGLGGGSRAQMTSDYETRQVSALQTLLDRVLGPGHAVAQVTAQLNFDAIDTTTEKLTSDPKTAPIAESTTTEKYTGTGSGTGGVLGTDNIAVPSGAGGNGSYTKTTGTKNNSISKTTQKTVAAPGGVAKQSVAVVVDSALKGVQIASLQSMVSTAAGIDPKRGDTLSVTTMAFDTTAATKAAKELAGADAVAKRAAFFGYIKQGAIGLLILLAVLLAWVTSRKKSKKTARRTLDLDLDDVVTERPLALTTNSPVALDSTSRFPSLAAASPGAGAPGGQSRRRDDVADLVERQPEEVAELLRGWLADRRG